MTPAQRPRTMRVLDPLVARRPRYGTGRLPPRDLGVARRPHPPALGAGPPGASPALLGPPLPQGAGGDGAQAPAHRPRPARRPRPAAPGDAPAAPAPDRGGPLPRAPHLGAAPGRDPGHAAGPDRLPGGAPP